MPDGTSSQRPDGSWDPAAGTIYVWYEALVNYVTGAGFPDDAASFAKWWPADLHVIGKDIARFHTIYWPAMLWSAGLEAPRHVWIHGWLLAQGERMSKSRGNFLDPIDVVRTLGADGARYVTMREVPFDRDADVSWDSFVRRYNSDLANNFGNLLNRTVSMVNRYLEGERPAPGHGSLQIAWMNALPAYWSKLEACQLGLRRQGEQTGRSGAALGSRQRGKGRSRRQGRVPALRPGRPDRGLSPRGPCSCALHAGGRSADPGAARVRVSVR
jgi:hypothetical protein